MIGFFRRPLVAVKVVVENDAGQILVLRRSVTAGFDPLQWDLPGGIIDPGEHPKAAAIRETMEETGIVIKDLELLDVTTGRGGKAVIIVYKAKVSRPEVALSHEHDQSRWLPPAESRALFASQVYRDAVKQ